MNSLLVANRGEIAVRVIRAAKELGMRSIAVYSELDRDALHVDLADDSWNIGPAPASESYLSGERIIKTALEAGADAIHPGYGFLAENAAFARAVIEAGLVWVGPPPDAIATMGDKISSRRSAEAAGVRPVPGTLEPLRSATAAAEIADGFGYPVAVKAAHGGGGKGMRVVHRPEDLVGAFEGAGREAEAYFGSAELYMERYLERPRHIEAQIVLDDHGNGVFLGERDCTVQRRHQKLIEETPSSTIEESTRKAIGEAALAVARDCGYVNAGTVEFLVDQENEFFFLEMNTRLQVEHAITEMVTGIDLVKEQLRVAAGEPLSFDAVQPWGHAMEFRINAEDPKANFTPGPGRVSEYREPGGFGVRVDSLDPARHQSQPVLRQPDGQARGLGPGQVRGDREGEAGATRVRCQRSPDHHPSPPHGARPPRLRIGQAPHQVDRGRDGPQWDRDGSAACAPRGGGYGEARPDRRGRRSKVHSQLLVT